MLWTCHPSFTVQTRCLRENVEKEREKQCEETSLIYGNNIRAWKRQSVELVGFEITKTEEKNPPKTKKHGVEEIKKRGRVKVIVSCNGRCISLPPPSLPHPLP